MASLARLARRAFRSGTVRRIAFHLAAARSHGLILLFHRITDVRSRQSLVPSVPEALFRQQLQALATVGDIVSIEDLLQPPSNRRRPRFALTFDDDWSSHYERVLPVLEDMRLTATFFLTGRALHGLGPLWFERLDSLVTAEGIHSVCRRLGLEAVAPEQLALACENELRLQDRINRLPDTGVAQLSRIQIRALADAGMTIAFHTLHHPLLPPLEDAALDESLTRGRSELEAAAGHPIRLFAYPHGKTDGRVASRLRRAGFVAACTGRPCPVRSGDDPYLLGRWEPGPIGIEGFVAGLATRLNGWSRTRD